MPYKVVQHGEKWLTVSTHDHAVRGTHPTKEAALRHRRALESQRRKGKK